jgi:hypothetical protein
VQTRRRSGIGSPLVLGPLSLLVAAGAGAVGLLLGRPAGTVVLLALLVPWGLSAAAGLAVAIAAARSPQARPPVSRPPVPREPVRSEQLVVDLAAWQIDLRDQAPLDLPRQQSGERP